MPMSGRVNKILVKTEWKKVLKTSALPVSEVALELLRKTVEGWSCFCLGDECRCKS